MKVSACQELLLNFKKMYTKKLNIFSCDDSLYFGVLLSMLIRWCVSLYPYSGAGKSPIFGDYEAQRHWMEITLNLPVKEWYKNSTRNDLMYWGLDYPPLTAYHSYICGYLAHLFNKDWVSLFQSRGFESYHHKIFMRTTVMAADIIIYFPAIVLYWSSVKRPYKLRDKAIASTLMLLYPGLILIDHGHFQYNCVSLGLMLWSILFLMHGNDFLAATAFTFSLHYKQMELYHAVPFFCYLLGTCFSSSLKNGLVKFLKLASIVIIISAFCWAPFLTSVESTLQVVRRLFPFDRGLYEDKVANIWCALSVIIKLKALFSISTLAMISGVTTFLLLIPSSVHLVYSPTLSTFKIALVNSSLVFFLFSFQVHEKSILLAAIPVLLLLEDHPFVTTWFLTMSVYSLFPLLAKDGLVIPYFSLLALYLVGVFKTYGAMGMSLRKDVKTTLKTILFCTSIVASVCFCISSFLIKPPPRYPHLHILLNAMYSCLHFTAFAIYFHYLQFASPPISAYSSRIMKMKLK